MARAVACRVITPTGIVFEDKVNGVKAPGFLGGFEVLIKHAPYMTLLGEGHVSLVDDESKELFGLDIESGFLTVADDTCTILVERTAASSQN
ncbi:MAG: F0F1 ATP synthase subunit epsilon [bacterium]|nr:F0F1 ATP synthase subunit epsilon [bacterium]